MKPSGAEFNAIYTLVAPDGSTAVFNNDADANFVGFLDPSESSGLDSPEVREDLSARVEDDGAIQGNNYYGQRTVVLTGLLRGSTPTQRNERFAKLQMAANALRGDAELKFTPAGGVESYLKVRKNGALRSTGGFAKKFQLPLVAADPRIYSSALHTLTKAINVVAEPVNEGSGPTPAIIELTGPQTNPIVENTVTGAKLKFTYALLSGHTLKIDLQNHTVTDGATNVYSALKFTESTWFSLPPGTTKLKCTTGEMKVSWRDAWL